MGFAHYNLSSNVFEFIFTFVAPRINTRRKIKTDRAIQQKRDNNIAISVMSCRTDLLLANMLSVKATIIRSCKLQISVNPVRRSEDMLSIYLGSSCLHFAMNAMKTRTAE